MKHFENKISIFINSYLDGIKKRPGMYGSIRDIEYCFFVIDPIYSIIYFDKIHYEEISWDAFLSFKQGFGYKRAYHLFPAEDSSSYTKFVKLRDEFYEWRALKIENYNNPEASKLLDILDRLDSAELFELSSWFVLYPSKKATEIYAKIIDQKYENKRDLSLRLSQMSDFYVLDWAEKKLKKHSNDNDFAIKIIACSPLPKADNIADRIITSGNHDNIKSLLNGYSWGCYCTNHAYKSKRIKQLIDLMPKRDEEIQDLIEDVIIKIRAEHQPAIRSA